jgi:hypothetical protein
MFLGGATALAASKMIRLQLISALNFGAYSNRIARIAALIGCV